jgi:hypothetical protein
MRPLYPLRCRRAVVATHGGVAPSAAQAPRGHLVVTRDVAEALVSHAVAWSPIGAHTLKGMTDPLELFALSFGDHPDRRADPVRGMEPAVDSAPFRLDREAEDIVFRSAGCRDRYIDSRT